METETHVLVSVLKCWPDTLIVEAVGEVDLIVVWLVVVCAEVFPLRDVTDVVVCTAETHQHNGFYYNTEQILSTESELHWKPWLCLHVCRMFYRDILTSLHYQIEMMLSIIPRAWYLHSAAIPPCVWLCDVEYGQRDIPFIQSAQ